MKAGVSKVVTRRVPCEKPLYRHPSTCPGETFTYADYCTWPDEERWELIDGVAYDMSPAPNRTHSLILGELSRQVRNYFHGKPCEVHQAPFDIRLPKRDEADAKVNTVVQPDLLVICDQDKLDEKGARGAPDLAIEVLSPSTQAHDQLRKLNLYENRGVKQYWIFSQEGTVMVFTLGKDGRYGRPQTYDRTMTLETRLFPGLRVDLSTVFPPLPGPQKMVREEAAPYGVASKPMKRTSGSSRAKTVPAPGRTSTRPTTPKRKTAR